MKRPSKKILIDLDAIKNPYSLILAGTGLVALGNLMLHIKKQESKK